MNEFNKYGDTPGYLSCMIAILYFGTIYGLEKLGSSTVWTPRFRGLLADYSYVVGQLCVLLFPALDFVLTKCR